MMSILITYYLVAIILIDLTNAVPLDGENVRDAEMNGLPFVVSLVWSGSTHNFCAGTLISRQSVLTSSHCLAGVAYNEVDIIIGSRDLREGTRYQPKSWISFGQWMNTSDFIDVAESDIAVIMLTEKEKKCIPTAVLTFARVDLDYSEVRIAGWGECKDGVSPMVLKTVSLTVISNVVCKYKIETMMQRSYCDILEQNFCSMAHPWVLGCSGDSGSPVLNRQNQVVGIHRGVCPEMIIRNNDTKQIVNHDLDNVDLRLYQYENFINAVKI